MRQVLLGTGVFARQILQALERRHQVAPARVPGLPVTEPLPAPLPPRWCLDAEAPLPPWPADQAPERVHLVFSPQELSPQALADRLQQLRTCQPGLQVELHLDRIAGADRLPLAGGLVCWVPAAGQADAQAMAAWLLQRLALQADSADLADSTDAVDPVAPAAGRLRSWALSECRADLSAVRAHLSEVLLGQLLRLLRQGLPGDAAPAAAVLADLPVLPDERGLTLGAAQSGAMWQRLALHYQGLVQQCEPARQAAELRRLFALGVHEGFDGRGVEVAMRADEVLLQQRAEGWCDEVEARLWQDWRSGRLSLEGVRAQAQQVRQHLLQAGEAATRQLRQDEALADRLQAALDEPPAPAGGLSRWFGGARVPDLSAWSHALQAWAQARTTAARSRRELRQVERLQTAWQRGQEAVEAADLALASLAAEARAVAQALLIDPATGPQRLDRPELVQALARTWVGSSGPEQRQMLGRLRADLFLRLVETARFETLAHQIGEDGGCEALRQACDRAVAAPVVASVAQSGVQWLQRRWADDALRGQDLARLQPRLAAPVAVQQRALAAPLRDRIDPAAALLPALGPRAAALVWLVLSVPLAELPEPVPALPPDLSPEMPPEPQPEPQPDPVPPWAARLLLAEALDLLRDGGAQGWLRAELDDFGLELALHPLGADWPAVLARLQDDADERRRLLDDALRPLLGAVPASARLREVIVRRVAVLGPAWSAPGAAALELLRQDGMNP